jgi:hypothetical protein
MNDPRHLCHLFVIPAQAGIQDVIAAKRRIRNWIPVYAGMTELRASRCLSTGTG